MKAQRARSEHMASERMASELTMRLDALRATSAAQLARSLTALYLVYYVGAEVMVGQSGAAPLAGLLVTGAGLALFTSGRLPAIGWLLCAGSQAVHLALNWQLVDNHVYLAFYWTLAVVVAGGSDTRDSILRKSGSALVAVTMLLAALHKLRTAEYLDGSFFYFALVTDGRFSFLSPVLDVDLAALAESNAAALEALKANPTLGQTSLVVERPELLLSFSRGFGWVVAGFEAGLGALALAALRWRLLERAAHVALLVFIVGTYTFVPVAGFGGVLCLLGLASAPSSSARWKAAYIASLAYVLFFAEAARQAATWALVG